MASDASVAPKERVNIVYRPATAQGSEEVELPLKMLVMGDFAGREVDLPVEKRSPVPVEKGNLDEVLKAQQISVELSVPNRLVGDGARELGVTLKMEALKDFEPEAIVRQVPELQRLLELREALRALKGPLANLPEFRRKLQELLSGVASREKLLEELNWQGEEVTIDVND